MASKFDIGEHIKVEALGTRAGELAAQGLVVNGRVYDQTKYVITGQGNIPVVPVAIAPLIDPNNTVTFFRSSADRIESVTITTMQVGGSFGVYAMSRDNDSNFSTTDNPYFSGVQIGSANLPDPPATGFPRSRTTSIGGAGGFALGTKHWLLGVYTANGTQVGELHKLGNFTFAAYTYSFPDVNNAAGPSGAGSNWQYFEPADLRVVRLQNSIYLICKDATHPGTVQNPIPIDYVVYFNDVLKASLILNNNQAYWAPNPSSDAIFKPNVGTNTIKLYRANAGPQVGGLPLSTVILNFGFTANYEYPTEELPFRLKKHSATQARIRFNPFNFLTRLAGFDRLVPTRPANYTPVNGTNTFMLKIHDQNGVTKIHSITLEERLDVFSYERIISNLDMDNSSYLFELFSVHPTTLGQTLYATASYGPNPPTQAPAVDPDAVLATGWWPVECSVSNVDIVQGYDIEKGLLKRPDPGSASISLKGNEGDPRVNTALTLDSKIRILLAEEASPTGDEEYLFSGFIQDLSTNYDTLGNINTTIGCVDAMSRVLNVTIPLYEYADPESFSRRMYNVLNDYIAPATWGVSFDQLAWPVFEAFDRSVFPPEFRENVPASEVINELTEGEYAIMVQNRGGVINWYSRGVVAVILNDSQSLVNQPPSFGFSTVHSPTSINHFCISDFTIENRIEDITNAVTVSLTYDEATVATFRDEPSIQRFGERSYEVRLNLHAPDNDAGLYVERWAEEVPYFEAQSELKSLSTNVVNRNGFVTRAYEYDASLDPIRVYIKTGPVDINGTWLANRVTHSITPEAWTMTLDLTAD